MFWTTFEMLCNSVGKAPSVVAAEIGIKSTGTVPGWKKGVKPRPSALRALADYFGVTVEYLLTGEGQKEKLPAKNDEELLDNYLIKKLIMLTPDEMEKVDAFVQGLLAARQA